MAVPNLRFRGFEGEWNNQRLNEFANINPKVEVVPDNFYYIDLEGVNNGILGELEYISKEGSPSRAQRTLSKNDVLYQTVRPYQKNNYYFELEGDYVASTGYAQLRTKNDSRYLFQFLHTTLFVNKVMVRSTGTSYPAINSSDLGRVRIDYPSLPEQRQIADFLSAVDEKIRLLSAKKEKLETYKKGVMQKLFPKAGQTNPELRFKCPDGSSFPDWEEKRLRDVANRSIVKNKASEITFVLTNSATQGIVSQQDYFDKDIANQSNLEGYYQVEKGDYVYNPRVSENAPVGPINRNNLQRGVMSPLYTVFRFNQEETDFYDYYFKTSKWHKYMKSVANYGARHDRMNISNEDFLKMPVPFPTEQERMKVCSFINSLNIKLNSAAIELDRIKDFKKGLLQQMFV